MTMNLISRVYHVDFKRGIFLHRRTMNESQVMFQKRYKSLVGFVPRSEGCKIQQQQQKRQFIMTRKVAPRRSNTLVSSRYLSSTPSTTSSAVAEVEPKESLPMIPINFDTSSSIQGEESQILEVVLEPNQILRAESGAMIYMTQGVQMSTSLGDSSSSTASGISEGLKRMLTGQNMFISDYTYHGPEGTKGTLALGTEFPSKILRLSLAEYGNKVICQKSAYLASDLNVDIQLEFTKKFSAGFFGGEGFILQGLVGDGDVFVKAGGTLVKKELKEGETIRVSSGSLVAFTQDVEFDIQMMPGFKNVLFGGEGLFVTTLTGPGTIWLQGMPPDRMISEITRRIPSSGGIGLGIPIMGGGSGGDVESSESGENLGEDGDSDGTEVGAEATDEDLVASSDAAIESDRNATVASSGVSDAESSSALFGDAAPSTGNEDDGTTEPSDSSNSSIPDLEDDSTTFSTEDDYSSDFGEDLTNDDYQQQQQQEYEDFQQDETSFSTESEGGSDESGEGGNGIMSTLWDIFFHDDE